FHIFFFSSRRRHTRFSRDWSSDVCSSDLRIKSMRQKENLKWSPDVLFYPLFLVMGLWIVFWIEHRFRFNLNFLGIYPRTIPGLRSEERRVGKECRSRW